MLPGAILGVCGLALLLSSATSVTLGGVTFGANSAIAGSLLFLVGYHAPNIGVFATLASNPIQRPNEVATETVIERMNLEPMSSVELVVLTAGALYITGALIQWATAAFSMFAVATGTILRLTAMGAVSSPSSTRSS